MLDNNIVGLYWVPGLPHILSPESNKGYKSINDGMRQVAQSIRAQGAERIIYYSTAWISVLGTSFQSKRHLEGMHVDENWHDFKDLPFKFTIDQGLSKALQKTCKAAGNATSSIDFDGFPVDTGTIVADTLVNPDNLETTMVSSNVYLDFEATCKLGQACAAGIAEHGKKTAVVLVSGFSGRFFTNDIDLREDHIRTPEDDAWNKKMLEFLQNKSYQKFEDAIPEFAKATKADMGLKAWAFGRGILNKDISKVSPRQHAYGSIYGTGAAVLEFTKTD